MLVQNIVFTPALKLNIISTLITASQPSICMASDVTSDNLSEVAFMHSSTSRILLFLIAQTRCSMLPQQIQSNEQHYTSTT